MVVKKPNDHKPKVVSIVREGRKVPLVKIDGKEAIKKELETYKRIMESRFHTYFNPKTLTLKNKFFLRPDTFPKAYDYVKFVKNVSELKSLKGKDVDSIINKLKKGKKAYLDFLKNEKDFLIRLLSESLKVPKTEAKKIAEINYVRKHMNFENHINALIHTLKLLSGKFKK